MLHKLCTTKVKLLSLAINNVSCVKVCTHLCGLVDRALSNCCTLNFLTTPISIAFFNKI